MHPWKEPVERIIALAESNGCKLLLPVPGDFIEFSVNEMNSEWWRNY
jgi:hypothetical protein